MIIAIKTDKLLCLESGYFDEGDDLALAVNRIGEIYPHARKRVIVAPGKWYTDSLSEHLVKKCSAIEIYSCPTGTIYEWGENG